MAPKKRNARNKTLPKYWRYHKGSYSYRVPPHLRHLHNNKTEVALGQSLPEAYQRFAQFYRNTEAITTMAALFSRYRLEVVSQHDSMNTRNSKYRCLDRLTLSMGDNPVRAITPQFIYKYRDHIGTTRSKKQANLDLEVLSHVFTKAIEWGTIADHPMTHKKVTKFSLKGRDRYVEDWELQEWATVANPFLVAYVVLKGATGLRQQDLLRIRKTDISPTELTVTALKTGKKLRYPRQINGKPTTVQHALDAVEAYYRTQPRVNSEWLFCTRKGACYYDMEKRSASGFQSVWQRSMAKALAETKLTERFTEHDLRAKVGSDMDTDSQATDLLAHSSMGLTRKHYRRKGQLVSPAKGFFNEE